MSNIEKISGDIYADDITELIHNINKNKNRLAKIEFNRRGDYWEFIIENEDSNDQKKIFKEIDKFIRKQNKNTVNKNRVKREKNNQITDEVIE